MNSVVTVLLVEPVVQPVIVRLTTVSRIRAIRIEKYFFILPYLPFFSVVSER